MYSFLDLSRNRIEYTQYFLASAFNVLQIYTHPDPFLLDICRLRLLLKLRQAGIVSNALKSFTNNAFLTFLTYSLAFYLLFLWLNYIYR